MQSKKVQDVMTRGIISVHQEDSLREVIETLTKNKIHSLAVTGPGGVLKGIISETDIVDCIDKKVNELTAEDIMSSQIITVTPETSLVEAAKMMQEHCHHRLLVMGKEQIAVGVLSASDIVTEMVKK